MKTILSIILFLSLLMSVNATEKSKYTRVEIRDLKNLRLEAIASRRYHKEAAEKHEAAKNKEKSKEQFIKDSEKSYKRLMSKYGCRGESCTHSRGSKCYRAKSTLRKAYAIITKAEKSLTKLAKDTRKKGVIVASKKAQFSKFLKAYLALKNKY